MFEKLNFLDPKIERKCIEKAVGMNLKTFQIGWQIMDSKMKKRALKLLLHSDRL